MSSASSSESEIRALGYVGFTAPDPKAWLDHAVEVIGLMPARALPGEDFAVAGRPGAGRASGGSGIGPDGAAYLKADGRQWRVAVHPDGGGGGGKAVPEQRGRLAYLGFEVTDGPALERTVERLDRAGVAVREGGAAQARSRGVSGLACLSDPAGNALELFYGPVVDHHFRSPAGMTFLTGALGLGHVNLLVSDLRAALEFYCRVLGFRSTDFIRFGTDLAAHFLRCNARHHTLGLTRVGEFDGFHHLMLEAEDVDQVGLALDRAQDRGVRITSSLGRHKNDRMLSFYMESPGGLEVEIGAGGLLVGDDWISHEFCEGDVWGHHGLTAEAIQASAARG